MERRHLIILAVIFAMVAGAYLFSHVEHRSRTKGQLYTTLTPRLSEKAVSAIEVWKGGAEERPEGLAIRRGEAGWQIRRKEQGSLFWVRAKETRVAKLLDALSYLKGDLRAASRDLFPQFHIGDDEGLHMVVLNKDQKPLIHLVVGKKGERWDTCYVRRERSDQIFLVERNLLSLVDIWSKWATAQPSPRSWTDLAVIRELPKDLEAISYEQGDVRWSLSKVEEREDGHTANASSEKKRRWKLVINGTEEEKDRAQVKSYLERLLPLQAKDVYPPDLAKGTGLGQGEQYGRLTLHFARDGIKIYHVGHKNEKGDKGWVRDSSGEIFVVPGEWIDLVTHPFQPKAKDDEGKPEPAQGEEGKSKAPEAANSTHQQ